MIALLLAHWRIGAAALALVLSFGAGWTVRAWKCDSAIAKIERKLEAEAAKQRARADAAAASYEVERSALSTQSTSSQAKVREIYRDVQVPADCAPNPDALRLLDDAISGDTGEPSRAVPANP